MVWYRINKNYLWNYSESQCLDLSSPAGKDESEAIKRFFEELAKDEKCYDDKSKPAKIDLTKYIYNEETKKTKEEIILKNY